MLRQKELTELKAYQYLLCLCLTVGLLLRLTGCAAGRTEPKRMTYYTYFDTVTDVYSYANETQTDFDANCQLVADTLEGYHQLFDIYHEYDGTVNLATVNRNAGGDALEVSPELIDFLLEARTMYDTTGGEMNVMMGAVLRLWHDCREDAARDAENARLPASGDLERAARHIAISALEIDPVRHTVRITDPEASLDVGALAKGYAAERAAERLKAAGADGYVLNIGGNLRLLGAKPDGSGWVTGIQDPRRSGEYAAKVVLQDTSCVTSGDYERYYTVDGVRYCHIIDKDTRMPARYFSSVTVITPDSALADALSTALFCMSYEDGLALVQTLENVQVLWILPDGTQYQTGNLPLWAA